MSSPIEIRRAAISDLDHVVPLFDGYRQFYSEPSNPEGARRFLQDRMERQESVIFLALEDARAVAFTQLYPSFSSVSMARICILNDLFVAPEARGRGTGAKLLQAAAEYGKSTGAVRLVLSTEVTNTAAQSVYERSGWTRDTRFCTYQRSLQ